jgi:hypothetical protein
MAGLLSCSWPGQAEKNMKTSECTGQWLRLQGGTCEIWNFLSNNGVSPFACDSFQYPHACQCLRTAVWQNLLKHVVNKGNISEMLVIRYCVWDFYDIRSIVTAFLILLQAIFGLMSTWRENSLSADKVTPVRVARQDGNSIIHECRTQSCDLQAD